ncbi:MAG: flagellar motor protein MotB [bacterium]
MAENGSEQIIIKKAKKGHGGHHGGAWKVAYADFVTAMMALFIVLWVLGQSEEVKQAVSSYFTNPTGIGVGQGKSIVPNGQPSNNSIEPSILNSMQMKEMEKQQLKKMGNDIISKLKESQEFQTIVEQIDMQMVDEGLRIEIMDTEEDYFFDSGTAQLKPSAVRLLETIGRQLSSLNNKIVLEGHTDSRAYPGDGSGYTNYELSCDRANAARRAVVIGGVSEDQLDEVRGYADNRLRNLTDPYDTVNRRISIIVKYKN